MTNLFNQLVSETAKLANVPVSQIPISRGTKKRWQSIADYWHDHVTIFSKVFYKALVHLATEKYPRNSSPITPLLTLIETAILTDTDALDIWRVHPSFRSAFDCTLQYIRNTPRWKSEAVCYFVAYRLYTRTFYRNGYFSPVNPAIATQQQLNQAHTAAKFKHNIYRFQSIIQLLIPTANTWSAAQWINERYIFACLNALYGIDYSKDPDGFDHLCVMLGHKQDGLSYCRDLFLIKDIPASMAKVIWPGNMEREICKQFAAVSVAKPHLLCGNHYFSKDGAAPFNVTSSWAYKQISIWRETGRYPISNAIKSNMMHFALGDHPYIIRKRQRSNGNQAVA